jgi:hypothetical protein
MYILPCLISQARRQGKFSYEFGTRIVGSLTPVGMSSDVVLDILGVELWGNVGSLTPVGMSSEVPTPVVALTIVIGTDSRNVIPGKRKIITMTPVCKEESRYTKHYFCP